jgi:hypothetical protein
MKAKVILCNCKTILVTRKENSNNVVEDRLVNSTFVESIRLLDYTTISIKVKCLNCGRVNELIKEEV